jgi:hypothetical protein
MQVYCFDKNKIEKNQNFKNTKYINFSFLNDIENFNKKVDLTIIATTARGRLKLIKSLIKNKCKYWVIEKMIEQNVSATNKICYLMKNYKCWVDVPRRGMKEYKIIKKILFNEKIKNINLKIKINGDRIITSSVHLVDLLVWLTNSSVKTIDTSKLNKTWTESKRKSFYDIGGELVIILKNNSKIYIKSTKSKKSGDIIIGNKNFYFIIDENNKKISCSNGKKFPISPPHVSMIMSRIIRNILLCGQSFLPTIEDVIYDHNSLIKNLKTHWEKTHTKKIKNLPVT